eukprot:CAMPEP_0197590568 /NCGR_PEP_ID=MMETSP1326-20131121/11486_1 /TAXON_ID=1155430 /ORGANISM="Genus nov. species nov., Strain RCC2288" /LENGTH=132 /DNA_ID=CAMNT_0043155673 /DNA_START=242 /DNA_END=636 /DNA_ORIENTATION=+
MIVEKESSSSHERLSPALTGSVVSCPSQELAVGQDGGRDEAPGVEPRGDPRADHLDPHAGPPHVHLLRVLRVVRAPARHEHGEVHGRQREDEVEEAVAVRHGARGVRAALAAGVPGLVVRRVASLRVAPAAA